ncbi:MAG: hypothetical protein GVY10_05815 [Verrucomicrobia bacterium]|nr:hypothetical protein [Verrucomicrobiota bacterium]
MKDILYKHWDAVGGVRNWSEIKSIRLKGRIERDGNIVDFCIVKKRPNQIRATVTVPIPGSNKKTVQIIRAHDGKTAWTATRLEGASEMQIEELAPAAAAELHAGAGVQPRLIKLWREGAVLKKLPAGEVNGRQAHCIEARNEETGVRYVFYLSTVNHQLLASESHFPDGSTTYSGFSHYEEFGGILLPRRSYFQSPRTGRSLMITESVEVDLGIVQEYFSVGQPLATAQAE